jgi:NADH-quinone oxidoreductase subunit F
MADYQNPMRGSPLEVKVLTRRFGIANSASLEAYLAPEGYQALKKALEMKPDDIIQEMKKSGLRGRGGAGFNAGMKWSFVPKQTDKPKYVVCNADEGEPGTCKDRVLMEYDPHQLIEGIIIAGYAIQAHQGYIYIRGEYRYLMEILDRALAEAYAGGYLGKNILGSGFDFELSAHTGAGSYECGEETALLNSLEGLRGYPRVKPPFPAVIGLYGCPTVINNVETLSNVPHIVLNGAAWFAKLGKPNDGGTRLFCLSGHIARPGIYELPMGFPLRRMIEEVGGGVWHGKKLKCVIPGGSSCPVLTADEIDIPMDFDSLAKAGSMLGSGGVVILDEDTCMVKTAWRIMKFYAHESCGWCVPCREGTLWLKALLERFHAGGGLPEDPDNALDIAYNILGKTLCPLGDAAAMPIISILEKFRHEFEEHLRVGGCPFENRRSGLGTQDCGLKDHTLEPGFRAPQRPAPRT